MKSFKLWVIGPNEQIDESKKEIEIFFKNIYKNNLHKIFFLDTFSEECHSNNFYEFGGIDQFLKLISKPENSGFTHIFVNTTVLRSHSKIFVRYLNKIFLKSFSQKDVNFIFGEIQKNTTLNYFYLPTYFFIINLNKPLSVNFLEDDISKKIKLSTIKKKLDYVFRRFVFDWIKPQLFRGWYGSDKSFQETRRNYKRKMIQIYYEKKFYEFLKNEQYLIIEPKRNFNYKFNKFLDKFLNFKLKIIKRYL